MYRALFALVLGAAGGAALTYYLVAPDAAAPTVATEAAAARRAQAAAAPAPRAATGRTPNGTATAARAETYRAAAEADAPALARLIEDTAAQPASATRGFTLGVLLTRYAELDPERAVEIAGRADANGDLLATLYAAWAGTDPADALASLSGIDDHALAAQIGVALLPVLGGDDYAVQQVLAALPASAERDLRVTAITDLAQSAPAAAFEQALDLADPLVRSLAVEHLAQVWARRDARAALARVEEIDDDELRATFQGTVLREWARFDADGLFDHFASLDADSQEQLANGGLMELARVDPQRAFELSTTLPSNVGAGLQQAALRWLGQQNPVAALTYLDRVPNGQVRQMLRQTIGRTYGERNPDAALDWARATGMREDLNAVLGGVARNDVHRAFEIGLSLSTDQERNAAMQTIALGVASDRDADIAGIADRLIALNDPVGANALVSMTQIWITRQPERALDWVMANAARVPAETFNSVARSLGANNPAAATQYFAQIPSEMRASWLAGAAQGYAQSDPRAAAQWIGQYLGQPGYANAAASVAGGLARVDAPAAAQMLSGLETRPEDAPMISGAANNVAMRWAQSNGLAAAEWAASLPSGTVRSNAMSSAAGTWAGRDYPAARSWTMRLQPGETRDVALNALVTQRSTRETPDPTLIGAFSTETARQQAVLGAIRATASRDPAEARALIDRYLNTPAQREQAERIIEQSRLGPGAGRFPGQGPIPFN